ncbi:hypothetical protein C9374_013480 [Naegleria lovaniensis]|uniref:3'-5' exonuclease domain-containing protein n=1 Tax=Naegleria lovaniensis TaxID=51637 RepID=A0AA88GZD7_NAELO|nr:uncharacterized protein C9374_013480 [Naegleria lovaniensis]KAG2391995.1 hypothetical protein C9374_013480 [Naegleria lovaniensis]
MKRKFVEKSKASSAQFKPFRNDDESPKAKKIKTYGIKSFHTKINRLIDTLDGDDETQLIIFINNCVKYLGEDTRDLETGECTICLDMDIIQDKLSALIPRLSNLLTKDFIRTHSEILFGAVIEQTDDNRSILKCKTRLPTFFLQHEKTKEISNNSKLESYMNELIVTNLLSYIGMINLYTGKACRSIGQAISCMNFFKKSKSEFTKHVHKLLQEDYSSKFIVETNDEGKIISVWNKKVHDVIIDENNVPMTSMQNGDLLNHFNHVSYSDCLCITCHLRDLDEKLWQLFMDKEHKIVPFIIDTEWNGNDKNDMGCRVLQIATSKVCMVILVDFDEKPPEFLTNFLFDNSFKKIGFGLCTDMVKLNNWLIRHDITPLDTNFRTDIHETTNGFIEGDPFSMGLHKLTLFCGHSSRSSVFNSNLKYPDYKWSAQDLLPWTPKGNKRLEYAALDVLTGYHLFESISSPLNHLFSLKLKMEHWSQDQARSQRVFNSLTTYLKSARASSWYRSYSTLKHGIRIALHKNIR